MARAKNTDRAEARRRHREQNRVVDETTDVTSDDAGEAAAVAVAAAEPSLGGAMRGSMRMPDIRADLRILPSMIATTRKLWIPFVALFVAFILAMLLSATTTEVVNGETVVTSQIIPEGLDRIAALFVQLTLPPTALFVFFVGGFLAPRASYLVGAVLGLVDGILWSIYVFSAGGGTEEGFQVGGPVDVLAIIFIAMIIGTLSAGFAAWYRNFLRQSQERARQNRMAREQAMRAKAKDDERNAREEQRKAAAAAREASRSGSKGTPPKS